MQYDENTDSVSSRLFWMEKKVSVSGYLLCPYMETLRELITEAGFQA